MQMYADVTRRDAAACIESEQGPALGAAMHAAVAAGCYADIEAAAAAMGKVRARRLPPDAASSRAYDALYAEYDDAARLLRPRGERRHAPPAARSARGAGQ